MCCLMIMRYHMEEFIRDSIEGLDVAKFSLESIDKKLFKIFSKNEINDHLNMLHNLSYDGASRISSHIDKAISCYRKLLSIGAKLLDDDYMFDAIRSSYNAQKEQSLLEDMTTILSSQKINFPHKYFSKQFKKKTASGKPNTHTGVQSSGTKKDSFLGKCNFYHKFGHKKVECRKFKAWLEKLDEKSSMLWHKFLGLISKQRIEKLVKTGLLHNLNFADFDTCIDCIKGKLTAKFRKRKNNKCKDILEMIHTDICGHFPLPTMGGYRYFIAFIDDFFCYGYVELICEKLDSLEVFKAFKTKVELQKGKKIKMVNSYKGEEYYGRYDETGRNPGPFANFLQECGIEAIYTMPSTPEQNGIAERRNCTHTY
ncbi:hypothetical protein UlMin_014292 [Ulmus minor]